MPYVAHKKLVTVVHTPVRIYHSGTYLPIKIHSRVRPSIIAAELNRIRYLTRPSFKSYTENYLNSKDYIDFDDETREIRAKTDDLLRRIHVFIPRPILSHYNELSPERLRSDDYVRRIINAKNISKDIDSLPWYETPVIRNIGTGNLACIKYAGGRPQPRRRPYYTVGDLVPGDVRSDVNLMSYYLKNRKAAEDASPQSEHHNDGNKEAIINEIPEQMMKEQDDFELTETESKPKLQTKTKSQEDHENDDFESQYNKDVVIVKKQPDEDTIRKVQEYLEKKAAEKKMEEDRRAWEAAERRRIAEEKEIARLAKLKIEEDIRIAEIKEQERLEAERQTIIARAEAARLEAIRLIEDEKLYNEAVAQAIADEEDRAFREKEKEELERRQTEEEDKLANLAFSVDTTGIDSGIVVLEHSTDEYSGHINSTYQDKEAKPYEVDHDEDTEIEEDEHEENNEIENPFNYGEAALGLSEIDELITETPKIKETGYDHGEQGFDWSQYESEHEEEACEKSEGSKVEETYNNVEQHQMFEESEIKSVEVNETQLEEIQVTEEVEDIKSEEKFINESFQEENEDEENETKEENEDETKNADEQDETEEEYGDSNDEMENEDKK
ncbi:PREDICTED: glutamic acid-rich protein-like [Ceratosolen solmsi marchali]|uniref:Glutamic acid-rich protein-like n=1 Tax=Ceratosolen solmsi marchali TaxID=326594 RepID=A0AAJ6YEE8_9HYME|nr:PREDICTED: glutamic acid-rich protein-like [Ceratosolen solmsi marchali]